MSRLPDEIVEEAWSAAMQHDRSEYPDGWGYDNLRAAIDHVRAWERNELDALAGEWRSVHNLLMEAAVKARGLHESLAHMERMAGNVGSGDPTSVRYAAACEAVATRLSNP